MGLFFLGDWTVWAAAAAVVYGFTLCLIPAALLSRQSSSSGKVAWILAIVQLPVLGGLLYLVFGVDREKKYAAAKTEADAALTGLLPDRDEEDPGDAPEALRAVWDLAGELAGHPAAGGNAVHIEPDPRAALGAMVEAVEAAENTVCAQFYTLRDDRIGDRFAGALTAAARRGVEVRLLYDRFGSLKLSDAFLNPLKNVGGRAVPFQPRGNGLLDRLRLNLRDHRKILVVDGGRAFCGGVNVGDEYMSEVEAAAPWRDTMAELRGPAAGRLTRVFAQDWLYMTGEELADERFYDDPRRPRRRPATTGWRTSRCGSWTTARTAATGCTRASTPPPSTPPGSRSTLGTGYFVPTAAVDRALQCAARRGVRVRVIHGGPGSPALTRWAARWAYSDLLDAGVEVYERREGTYHVKALCVDGRLGLLGSPNCDARSFRLNFECSLLSLDERFAGVLADQFAADLPTADRIDEGDYRDRPATRKLGEAAAHLFSPVL